MKRIIFIALTAIAFITLPSFTLSPAEVIDSHSEVDFVGSYATCDGTVIDLTGTETYDTHIVLNKNRVNNSLHAKGHYTGVDADGNEYIGRASYVNTANTPADNGAYTQSFIYQAKFISKGSAPNFYLRQNVKVTVNANGETTVERIDISTSCD